MTTATPASILLVEDEPQLRHALRLLLEDHGYQVSEAGTAARALALAARSPPRLVLLDLGLPDRPGLEVARALLEDPATGHVRVVALTGSARAQERQRCREAGCAAYLPKPVRPQELLRALALVLDRDDPA